MSEQVEGSRAHARGIPRFANPHIARQARAWAFGWNTAHGVCGGCDQCGSGTREMPENLVRYLKANPPNKRSSTPVAAGNRAFEGN
mgnify:CR=1 FL=1